MRFRTQLFLSVIPLVLVAMISVPLILGVLVRNNLLEQEQRILGLQMENLFQDTSSRMESLANLNLLDNPFYVDRIMRDLESRFNNRSILIMVLDQEGKVLLPHDYPVKHIDPTSPLGKALGQGPGDRILTLRDPQLPQADHDYMVDIRQLESPRLTLLCLDDIEVVLAPLWVALQGTMVLSLLMVGGIAYGLYRMAVSMAWPLNLLSHGTRDFAEGRLDKRIELKGAHEFILLSQDFNLMAERLQELTTSLETKVNDRTRDLTETRDQLVQMEKMAALGSLVSGFSHELNTPLGNALTTISFAHSLHAQPQDASTSEKLHESLSMAMMSLERAVAMMNRFRQVSADQHGGDMQEINLARYFTSNFKPLMQYLGQGRLSLHLTCPENLEVTLQQAVLDTVFSELLDNISHHGYPDGYGIIYISAEIRKGDLVLIIGDEGRGPPPQLAGNLFDPFVTSSRHEGKMGLGLHITFNLVTRQLKGTIRVLDKKPGTWIMIRIPVKDQ